MKHQFQPLQNLEPSDLKILTDTFACKPNETLAQFAAEWCIAYQRRLFASPLYRKMVGVANVNDIDVFVYLSTPGELEFQGRQVWFRATFAGDFETFALTADNSGLVEAASGYTLGEPITYRGFLHLLDVLGERYKK